MDLNQMRKQEKVRQYSIEARRIMRSKEEAYTGSTICASRSPKKQRDVKIPLPSMETYPTLGLFSDEEIARYFEEYPELSNQFECLKSIKEMGIATGKYRLIAICVSSFFDSEEHFISATLEIRKEDIDRVKNIMESLHLVLC